MYNKEFYNELEKINEEFYRSKLFLETVHPEDIINNNQQVLTEASINLDNIKKQIMKIINAIVSGLNKFTKMTSELIKRNDKLIQSYKKIDVNLIDFSDFEYEINDVGTAYSHISSFTIPPFNSKDVELIMNNESINFKTGSASKFPNGVFSEDGQVNKSYFDGSSNVIKVNSSNATQIFKDCLNILVNRGDITNKIKNDLNATIKIAQQAANMKTPITESALFDLSIYQNDYLDILLEDIIATTDQIQKEQKDSQNGINVNASGNQDKARDADANRARDAVVKYTTLVYDVISKMMSALDDIYNQAGKYCGRVSQLSNKHNK